MSIEITLTLSDVLERCHDWETFCEEQGWSVYAVNEGGGDCEVRLSIEDARKYGLLREVPND